MPELDNYRPIPHKDTEAQMAETPLLELIDWYGNEVAGREVGDEYHEVDVLRAEIARRIALAQADRSIHWKSHMDNDSASHKRQRFLISFAAQSPGHQGRQRAAEHARMWPLDTPEETK